jgi:hypothetical protein
MKVFIASHIEVRDSRNQTDQRAVNLERHFRSPCKILFPLALASSIYGEFELAESKVQIQTTGKIPKRNKQGSQLDTFLGLLFLM